MRVQSVRSADFWLLFWAVAVGTGGGLALLNNLAQLAAAQGGARDAHVVFVSLFSIANCCGRLLAG